MESLLQDKDTIYFLIFLASIGGSALLVKHNVNDLLKDRDRFQKKIEELEDYIIKVESQNKLTDKDLMSIFVKKEELNDKISCLKYKIDDLHELVKELYEINRKY